MGRASGFGFVVSFIVALVVGRVVHAVGAKQRGFAPFAVYRIGPCDRSLDFANARFDLNQWNRPKPIQPEPAKLRPVRRRRVCEFKRHEYASRRAST